MTNKNSEFFYAIWCENLHNIQVLKDAFEMHSKKYAVIDNIKTIIKKPKAVIFAEEDLLSHSFFIDNKNVTKKIDELSWVFIIIGTKRKIKPFPYMIKRMNKNLKSEKQISEILSTLSKAKKKPKQNNVLSKKINRLIYIYVNLYEKETITYDEINSVSLISKRTFLRDLETLRDILITQTIVFDENNRYYTLEDI